MTIRAVLVEDEPLAIDRLRSCLAFVDDVDLVGEARDGATAVVLIDRLQPDLVFLDIQLPALSGFEILRAVRHRPAVIFVTAHDDYAVSAFEWGAFDYLLKPFDSERVLRAVARFRERGRFSSSEPLTDQVDTAESREALRRFFVKQQGAAIPIYCENIQAIVTEGDYCRVTSRAKATWFICRFVSSRGAWYKRPFCASIVLSSSTSIRFYA